MKTEKEAAVIESLCSCLQDPEACSDLADYMHDMGNDARGWLKDVLDDPIPDPKHVETYRALVRQNDLCERLLRALAALGEERKKS